jgi:hypothetical protein
MLSVVEKSPNGTNLTYVYGDQGQVCVRSDCKELTKAIEELQGPAARQFALNHAQKMGMSKAGCGIVPSPYPVDGNGEMMVNSLRADNVAYYQVEIPLQASLA